MGFGVWPPGVRRDPGRRQHAGEGAGHVHGRARVRGVRREDRLRDGRTCRRRRIQQADDQATGAVRPRQVLQDDEDLQPRQGLQEEQQVWLLLNREKNI